MTDRYVTCQRCRRAVLERYAPALDAKPICHPCLDHVRYGAERKRCARRGHHVTRNRTLQFPSFDLDAGTATFDQDVECACGQTGRFVSVVKTNGYAVQAPQVPKRWRMVNGNPAALARRAKQARRHR